MTELAPITSNGTTYQDVWLPRLIKTWLDEEAAKSFSLPITWEVLKPDNRDDSRVEYAGLIDYDNEDDRKSLGQLSRWCFKHGLCLMVYQETSLTIAE